VDAVGGSRTYDGLFPVLDADIKVTGADEQAALLDINAAYRPPLSLVGAAADL
jgi:hypothetical protein